MRKYILLILSACVFTGYSQGFTQNIESEEKAMTSPFPFLDISVIADFSAVYRSIDEHEYSHLSRAGFGHSQCDHDHGHAHDGFNANPGLNLNYAELVLASAVDPFFDFFSTYHLSEHGFEIEELYVDTKQIPAGIQLRIGKFLSGFGRLNQMHHHYRDFSDQPIVYNAIFGDHGLLEKGIRASYTFPAPFYLSVGFEVLQGDNAESFGREGFESDDLEVEDAELPEVFAGYFKGSVDIGRDLTLLGGISGAYGKTRFNHGIKDGDDQETGVHGVEASTWIGGLDLTAKYSLDSYRYISFQTEGLYRHMKGDRYGYDGEPVAYSKTSLEKKQGGFYTQAVVKPFLQWRIGARYELIPINKIIVGGTDSKLEDNFSKASLMVDYMPSEFTFIRLQYNYDNSNTDDGHKESFHEIIVQMNFAIGTHGAHNF